MEKTYSEARGAQPFDWNKYLQDRLGGIPFAPGERTKSYDFAASWVTCACGNQCAAIPRDVGGVPRDAYLSFLGGMFYSDIISEQWENAKETLAEIEARSAFLLAKGGNI